MKKLKMVFITLVLGITIFAGIKVNALTTAEEQFISDEVLSNILTFDFFEEGSLPSMRRIASYALGVCFDNDGHELYDYCEDYLIDLPALNETIFSSYRVPAELIENYVSNSFVVDEEFFVEFRERFAEGDYNNTGTYKYVEYDEKYYYEFAVVLGMGGIDSIHEVTEINDLGNNYYSVEHYFALPESDLGFRDYEIPENPVEGIDYVMSCGIYGNCETEKRYFITEKYATKVHYDSENVRFISFQLVDSMNSKTDKHFLEGANQKFDASKDKNLTFRIDAEFNLFDKVYINNKEVDSKNYAASEGSTVITFNDEYTKSLKNGKYDLKVTFTDGTSTETTFTIANSVDNTSTGLYTSLGILTTLGILGCAIVFINTRKHSKFPQV